MRSHRYPAKRATAPPRVDPLSRSAISRFLLTLGMTVLWAAACMRAGSLPEGGLATMLGIAAATTSLLAVYYREPFRGPTLNRWDEAAAFVALQCLARLVA